MYGDEFPHSLLRQDTSRVFNAAYDPKSHASVSYARPQFDSSRGGHSKRAPADISAEISTDLYSSDIHREPIQSVFADRALRRASLTVSALINTGYSDEVSEDLRLYRRVLQILQEDLTEVLVQDMVEFAAEARGAFDSPAYVQLLANLVRLEEAYTSPGEVTNTVTAPHSAPF
jgi:hypothetical protein